MEPCCGVTISPDARGKARAKSKAESGKAKQRKRGMTSEPRSRGVRPPRALLAAPSLPALGRPGFSILSILSFCQIVRVFPVFLGLESHFFPPCLCASVVDFPHGQAEARPHPCPSVKSVVKTFAYFAWFAVPAPSLRPRRLGAKKWVFPAFGRPLPHPSVLIRVIRGQKNSPAPVLPVIPVVRVPSPGAFVGFSILSMLLILSKSSRLSRISRFKLPFFPSVPSCLRG